VEGFVLLARSEQPLLDAEVAKIIESTALALKKPRIKLKNFGD